MNMGIKLWHLFNCISVKLNFVQILMLLNVLDLKLDL